MKVLLVKMSSLGDIVHTLPAVADAVGLGVRFDWVIEESYQAVPALVAGVEHVLPVALRRWRGAPLQHRQEVLGFHRLLRRRHYDVVLDAQGLVKSAAVSRWARGRQRVGYDFASIRERPAALAYQQRLRVPRRAHAIHRSRRLFAAALGYDTPSTTPTFGLAARGRVPHVVLAHGSSWANKLWPEVFWSDIARRASAVGLTPMLPWQGGERERAMRIAAAAPGAEVCPRTDLAAALDLVANASAVVSVDSGLGHLGAALGRPTVMLLGPTDMALTGCQGACTRNLAASLPCQPCHSRRCRYEGDPMTWQNEELAPACMAAISPGQVWAALTELMQRECKTPAKTADWPQPAAHGTV